MLSRIFGSIRNSRLKMVVLLASLAALTVIVWVSLNYSGKNRLINKVEIKISPDTGVYFVTVNDVSELLSKQVGNPTGKSAGDVSLTKIETALKKLPFVASTQVFLSLDGVLKVSVRQRIPVVRVTNNLGETYFLDTGGYKIPHTGRYAPDVLAANGNIAEKLTDSTRANTAVLKDLLKLASFIAADPLWNAQFEQCHVDKYNDLILVPRVGRHSIVIGNAEDLPLKFSNLRVFYEKGLRNTGWEKYRQISLKYKGQVVGVRTGNIIEHPKPETVQKPQH